MALRRSEQKAALAREILRQHIRPGQTTMQPAAALRRLEQDRRIGSVIEARDHLKALRDEGDLNCEWVDRIGPVSLITLNLKPPPVSATEAAWRSQVATILANRSDVRPNDAGVLGDLWPKLTDWPQSYAAALVAELYDLRERLNDGEKTETMYLASARGGLASSKLLSLLPRAALQAFGLRFERLLDPPPYVIVAGQSAPRAVVLVENPEAFEIAATATLDLPVAWISAYGFGISHIDGAGARLASAIISPVLPIPLVRSGSPPPLASLLDHPQLLHWGDLDRSGLLIFHTMRAARPHLRLSALYAPMIDLLRAGGGHPYAEATGKPKQDHWNTEDGTVAALIELCADRAIDQEHLGPDIIRRLAMNTLEEISASAHPSSRLAIGR